MKEAGSKIRCTAMLSLLGLTVNATKVSTEITKNTVKENLHGQTEKCMMEIGKRENNTGRVSIEKVKMPRSVLELGSTGEKRKTIINQFINDLKFILKFKNGNRHPRKAAF